MKSLAALVTVASNTSWLFLERSIALVVSVAIGLYFVRYLGPTDYGLYSYAVGLYVIFATFSRLGLNALAVNEAVQDGSKQSEILGAVFALRLGASLVCILLLNVTASFLMDRPLLIQMTLILSTSILFGPFETVVHWFEANVKLRPIALARSLVSILLGLMRLGLIVLGASLLWFVWLVPVEALLTSAFFVFVYYRHGLKIGEWKPDRLFMKKFVREGAPLFLSVMAAMTYMKIDQVMLGKMTSPREVGLYAAAVRISELLYFVPVLLSGVLFPYLIKFDKRGEKLFRQAFQVMCDGFAWIALSIAFFVTLFAERIIALAYGPEYLAASRILVVHVWAGLFVFLETLRIRWFVIRQATLFQVITTSIGAVANVGLNLYLIPLYSGLGAAIATIVSYGLAIVFACFLSRKTWLVGTIMLKSLLAPFRVVETVRTLNLVRSVVDGESSRLSTP